MNYGPWLTYLFRQIDLDWEAFEMIQAKQGIKRKPRIREILIMNKG